MRFPLEMSSRIAGYVAKKKIARTKKFPMVLMLEPLHACNLTCTGCGRIREYVSTIKQKLSIDECLDSKLLRESGELTERRRPLGQIDEVSLYAAFGEEA